MTCPRCYAEFEPGSGACPDCGVQLLHNVSGMMKTSAIMIAAEGERGFYRSVQDVPEALRRQLLKVTSSENSGTIVIADQAGKEQLTQVVARRESNRERMAAPNTPEQAESAPSVPPGRFARLSRTGQSFLGLSWIVWAGIFLACGSAGIVAAVFTLHW
jgi:hypothetical protein